MRHLIYVYILLFLVSCTEKKEQQTQVAHADPEPIEIIVPDSTVYYDSLFAPYKTPLDTFFLNRYKAKTFYGAYLFAENGRIIQENSFGYAHLAHKDTLTTQHTFQLASASKPFTAVSIMQLVEQGKVNLEEDIRTYLPRVPYAGITIHQLLTHHSGLSDYRYYCDAPDSIWPDKHKTITNNDVLNIMNELVPMINYAPNTRFNYCNTNYMLLASVVEKISGLAFKDYLQQNIFEPLNMDSTVLYTRENYAELKSPTKGYNGAYNPTIDIYLNGAVGDKGVYSNVEDLLKFDQALYNGSLLSDSSVHLINTAHNKTQLNGQNYGYGFRMYENTEVGKIVFHTGWWKGFRTYFIRVIDQKQTVIVLTHIKRGPFLSVKELAGMLTKIKNQIE